MRNCLVQISLLLIISTAAELPLFAQHDTAVNRMDSFLLKRKGLLGRLAKSVMTNHTVAETVPVRNDLLYNTYQGKIIRNIFINRLDFGIAITDTTKKFKNALTKLANSLHHNTNEKVIMRNLFFRKGERLVPYLLADNERHLRDLPYMQDASIRILRAGKDSVDIVVITKDVLSIGGSLRLHSAERLSIAVSEDNLAGWGHEILVKGLFDNTRRSKFGYGAEYIARNISGSFIDLYGAYSTYNRDMNTGNRSEETSQVGIIRPLVNPYMKFTYAAEVAYHRTHDVYPKDTVYQSDHKYGYYNYDAWIGWNTGAFKVFSDNKENRTRTLIGLRYLRQDFVEVPDKYDNAYHYRFTDLQAVLSSITIFRQDFYKTQYVLGFGRNEDIPEGADISFITGWTKKAGVERPYFGLDLQRYFFTTGENYFSYTLKADGFLRKRELEDVNLLFNVNFFSRLIKLGKTWRFRNFINTGIAHQPSRILNEPLFLQSDFGLREWRNDTINTGSTRVTLKAESVFFAPWRLINFRFAPFVFANLCYFSPEKDKFSDGDLYKSIGAGLRTRNESLVFQTIEFKAFYFPEENFLGDHWRFEVNANVRFRYNQQFIKKPAFVQVN